MPITAANARPELPEENLPFASPLPPPAQLGVIARSEVKFLTLFTLVLCVVTTLPYVYGYLISFPGTEFTGILEHSYDSNNYLAYAHQAASGEWLFRNPMTGEPHRSVFFNFEWLVIGKISYLLRVPLGVGTCILRLLCLVLMCYGVYWLSSFLFSNAFVRSMALVATMAGGGFGWIAAVHLLHIPIDSSYFLDLTIPYFPFYWALKLPHFLVSESFVVLSLGFFLCAERSHRPRHYLAAGLRSMAAGACRPYDMLFLMAATSLFLGLSYWDRSQPCLPLALRALPVWICIPLLGYYYWIFKIHPVFRWWSLRGSGSPSPWMILLAFGMSSVLLPFAVRGLVRRGPGEAGVFLLVCLLTAVVLSEMHSVFHFSFQFATSIPVPLFMIVLLGLERTIMEWRNTRRWGTAGIIALLILNSLTSIAMAGQAVVLVKQGDFRADSQLLKAYSWLNEHSHPGDVTFADFDHSNELPQYVRSRVFCGYINAVDRDNKMHAVHNFLDPQTPNSFREQFLHQNSIQFVLLTAQEARDLIALGQAPFLEEDFRNNAAVIFRVRTL